MEKEKELIYYEQIINAWINNRMEHNKQLIYMSFSAIGFIIYTLIPTKNIGGFIIFFVTIGIFTVCILILLNIYTLNTKLIDIDIDIDKADGEQKTRLNFCYNNFSCKIKLLDGIAKWLFFIGVLFALILVALKIFTVY